MQTTVGDRVSVEGPGLHFGEPARMEVMPAVEGYGIRFVRHGLPGGPVEIPASYDRVSSTQYRTELSSPGGVRVSTIEHFMAAVAVLGIDNAAVSIDGPEVPALDGSAYPFAQALLGGGVVSVPGRRRAIRVLRKVEVEQGGSSMVLLPAAEFRLSCSISFESPAIGHQTCEIERLDSTLVEDLLPARTFSELEGIGKLKRMGLALGGGLHNAVVVSGEKVLNENGLRFSDEFVRHKALDVVGDLRLAGAPILGHCIAVRPGHEITWRLLKALFADRDAWCWSDSDRATTARAGATARDAGIAAAAG